MQHRPYYSHTQEEPFSDGRMDLFYPVQYRRDASRLYELNTFDDQLASNTRAAIGICRMAVTVPVLTVPVADYYVGWNRVLKLRVPTAPPEAGTLVTSQLQVSYFDPDGEEQVLSTDNYRVSYTSKTGSVIFNTTDLPELDQYEETPVVISYQGGYEVTQDRLDLIRDQIGLYLSVHRNLLADGVLGTTFQERVKQTMLVSLRALRVR